MNESVLVLGAGGFIGNALSQALAMGGTRIFALSRVSRPKSHLNIEYIQGNFYSPDDFSYLLARCSTVIHLASSSTPSSSAGHPLQELERNLRVTLALLESLQKNPHCKLIFTSSGGTIYGERTAPAEENSTIHPRSYHGAGKAASEHFIHAWAEQYSSSATILRPSNIYGPEQPAYSGFGIISAAFNNIIQNKTLEIWGDGSAVRDYLYIDDFIGLCLEIIRNPMPIGVTTLNASSGIGIDLNHLFQKIEITTGMQLKRSIEKKRSVDISRIELDPSAAHEIYNWKATTSIDQGLKQTWNWWKNRDE